MGFSRGGQTALYASLKRFQQAFDPEVAFAAYIPLYASCNATLIGDTEVSGVPIRLFHGTADDYVPVAPCRGYVERLRAAGKDVRLTDWSTPTTPTTIRSVPKYRPCRKAHKACEPAI
jgi:predicted esterase